MSMFIEGIPLHSDLPVSFPCSCTRRCHDGVNQVDFVENFFKLEDVFFPNFEDTIEGKWIVRFYGPKFDPSFKIHKKNIFSWIGLETLMCLIIRA